jgi:hypothetical protein
MGPDGFRCPKAVNQQLKAENACRGDYGHAYEAGH